MNNRQNGRRRGRNNNQRQPNNRGGDSGNRIDSRARGNATQLLEKYKNMARDAQTAGDRVMTEYYLQFADHYFRVMADVRARQEEQRAQRGEPRSEYRNDRYDGRDFDGMDDADDQDSGAGANRAADADEDGDHRGSDHRTGDRQTRPQNRDHQGRDNRDRNDGQRRSSRDDSRNDGRSDGRDNRRDGRNPRRPDPRDDVDAAFDVAILPPAIGFGADAGARVSDIDDNEHDVTRDDRAEHNESGNGRGDARDDLDADAEIAAKPRRGRPRKSVDPVAVDG